MPLELKTRKILKDNGYWVTTRRYPVATNKAGIDNTVEVNYIWRELDIYAERQEKNSLDIRGCHIDFKTTILGECKFSSDKDLFVFEHTDPQNVDFHRFPIRVNGHQILSQRINKYFHLPSIAERVIEVDVGTQSREKDNFSDHMIHNACEQLLPAILFNLKSLRDYERVNYLEISRNSRLQTAWDVYTKENTIQYRKVGRASIVTDDYLNSFLKKSFNPDVMLKDFSDLQINLCFPLIITDENRGIIKAKLDDSYNIIDFDDIGMCIYPYISENANDYQYLLENSLTLPILICNLSKLQDTVDIITNGVKQLVSEAEKQLNNYPEQIPREIFFNDKIVGI